MSTNGATRVDPYATVWVKRPEDDLPWCWGGNYDDPTGESCRSRAAALADDYPAEWEWEVRDESGEVTWRSPRALSLSTHWPDGGAQHYILLRGRWVRVPEWVQSLWDRWAAKVFGSASTSTTYPDDRGWTGQAR